jgi:enamine deaminase RidA (YjgF/YER057c/UK114 family)
MASFNSLGGWVKSSTNLPAGMHLRTATLNALSAARAHVGSLDRVTRVVSVKVYLATAGDFYNQPIVADAASELLRDVFGEDKMSVRSVLGVTALPLGAPVMLEVTFEVEAP